MRGYKKRDWIIAGIMAVFCIIGTVLLLFGSGISEKSGNMEFKLNESKDAYVLTSYNDTPGQTELVIPDEFNGLPVTAIGELAVQRCDNLSKIVIGKNIESIDKWGIINCRYLKKIVVDEENKFFSDLDGIMMNRDKTTLLVYPNAHIAEYDKNGALKETVSVAVPEGVETISYGAFYKCYAIEEIILPPSVSVIEERAFHGCENLKSAVLNEGLRSLGKDAFMRCYSLAEITLPSTLREVGDFVFYDCNILRDITILAPQSELKQGSRWLPEAGRTAVEPVWKYPNEFSSAG